MFYKARLNVAPVLKWLNRKGHLHFHILEHGLAHDILLLNILLDSCCSRERCHEKDGGLVL
jgi:hypothetical protein